MATFCQSLQAAIDTAPDQDVADALQAIHDENCGETGASGGGGPGHGNPPSPPAPPGR